MCEICGSEYLLDYGVVEVCMSCGGVVAMGVLCVDESEEVEATP